MKILLALFLASLFLQLGCGYRDPRRPTRPLASIEIQQCHVTKHSEDGQALSCHCARPQKGIVANGDTVLFCQEER